MCIALVGGIDRLNRHYREEADLLGVELRVFNRQENNICPKLDRVDAILIFTNKVSHQLKGRAIEVAKKNNIPVVMQHGCGLCTLRNCLNCLLSSVIDEAAFAKSVHNKRRAHQ